MYEDYKNKIKPLKGLMNNLKKIIFLIIARNN